MADQQNEYGLPIPGGNNKRNSAAFLPRFFRTQANKKFLQATLDQLIQPGVAEKINGYYGRKNAKAFSQNDNYIGDVSSDRENYQLEPSLVIKDNLDNVTFYKDYNDYINQIGIFGGRISDHSKLNSQKSYPWNPNIDWDKFANFREYYWLPNGPIEIPVRGQSREITSTYKVTLSDEGDNQAYVFTPNGLTRNPTLKLYRGQTYRFEIDTPGHPMAFSISRSFLPGSAVIVSGVEGVKAPGLFDSQLYGNEYDISDFFIAPPVSQDFYDQRSFTIFDAFVKAFGNLRNISTDLIGSIIKSYSDLRTQYFLDKESDENFDDIWTRAKNNNEDLPEIYNNLLKILFKAVDAQGSSSWLAGYVAENEAALAELNLRIVNAHFGTSYTSVTETGYARDSESLYDLVDSSAMDLLFDYLIDYSQTRFAYDVQLGNLEYNPNLNEYEVIPSGGSVTFGDPTNVSTLYPDGITNEDDEGNLTSVVFVEKGTIEFTIPFNSPNRLFYISKNDINTSGIAKIYDVEENTFLDVENEIVGKKTYTSANNVRFSNGMKVYFQGDVTPEKYSTGNWYVEGVGDEIKLINEKDLIIPAAYSSVVNVPFDNTGFDRLPYEDASAFAGTKDYIVINRASRDRNAWSRYNRWFHKDVIEESFRQNELPITIDNDSRAKRPIIEFEAGLWLYNFGTEAKQDIDLVDTFTTDVFSTIEGQIGYNIDGVDVADGMRILFTADTDILVKGKIYQVKFIQIANNRQISLIETEDTTPLENETVFVTNGQKNAGKTYWYNGSEWKITQEKTSTNQPPMFNLCCPLGNDYTDPTVFDSSTFRGTKVFSYKVGQGINDTELGFPLTYKNIENSGDIVFEFNLLTDSFTIQSTAGIYNIKTDTANLRKYKDRMNYNWVNGWSSTPVDTVQKVIRQHVAELGFVNDFPVDVYQNPTKLTDLRINVFKNNKLQKESVDYDVNRIAGKVLINFKENTQIGDVILLKTRSNAPKNSNGHYDIPINLERNPLNEDITEFTFGEVLDHVDSMIEDIRLFDGVYPGPSNLRDLGDLDRYGKRFVKHSGPINLPLYHLTNKKYNIVKALEFSKREYNKFKKNFVDAATGIGFDGPVDQHFEKAMAVMNKDKIKTQPFYFTDMLAYGPVNKIEYEVLDPRNPYYALSQTFDLTELSSRSVIIYLNGVQLLEGRDYTFDGSGFALIDANQQEGDTLVICEYDTTDGSYVPSTPTKLGLYPKYLPEITIDDTYQTEEPTITGPFKIYGELENTEFRNGTRGWVYPVYISKKQAQDADANGEAIQLRFKGLGRFIWAPISSYMITDRDTEQYDEYPVGIPMIRGHDGSFVKAYKDFRDNLLLEFESRIFNNIKQQYDSEFIDLLDIVPGKFRNSDISRDDLNKTLRVDFIQWLETIDNDYTINDSYDRNNQFTFNHHRMTSIVDGKLLPGFWRAVYKEAFDTDRPHSHPWEMLGFTIKPTWWDTVYGVAPYTSNNQVLWRDLEQGIVREPGKQIVVKSKFARPGLQTFIPSDEQGRLRSPLNSNYARNFFFRYASDSWVFGDESPVETAWRRSSDYPFALLRAFILNKPATIFGLAYDKSRIVKNLAGQYVYKDTGKHLKLDNLIFPNTANGTERISSSGLITYIYNLIASDIFKVYEEYKTDIQTITNQLGIKIGGFTDKSKFKLVLDSRSPSADVTTGVFVPEENYQIFLNTSSPIVELNYSGVIVEKYADGYTIRGYNSVNPVFKYFDYIENSRDIPITVGGISEVSSDWRSGKIFYKGQVVFYNSRYYRVTRDFTSGETFNTEFLALLPELPIVGGKTAIFRRNFNTNAIKELTYGAKLKNSQEVVDFILGYDAYLKYEGFNFNNFNQVTTFVENWNLAAKEFLYWTTQGWAAGTTISLSPAASELSFSKNYTVVDDIYDEFYNYSLRQANGESISRSFVSVSRLGNEFTTSIEKTDFGLYNINLPLVQKEHVVLIDNQTIFNDQIYNTSTGYRQERIKVLGYRSDDWNGSLNIPGFVYDDAKVTEWEQWQDYPIGSLVRYKQFYYVAIYNVPGSENFVSTYWQILNEKPESELLTNFDYKINQFTDFYDLDSDNFDIEQQRMAQHLIGYQKRQYLANIINDDVSQYKFYQGFIQDKGTKNALDKLFKPLAKTSNESYEFYEEWAVQVGRYGNTDDIAQVEFNINEDKLLESPQSFELVETVPADAFDTIYRIKSSDVYDKPVDYTPDIFPTTNVKEYILSGGYVNEDDVEYVAGSVAELATGNVNLVNLGDYILLKDDAKLSWDVLQFYEANARVTSGIDTGNTLENSTNKIFRLTLDRWSTSLFSKDDIVGVLNASIYSLNGLFKVYNVELNYIDIIIPDSTSVFNFDQEDFTIVKLRSVRAEDLTEFNNIAQQKIFTNQKIWVDDKGDGNWALYENDRVYSDVSTVINPEEFDSTDHGYSHSMTVTSTNNDLFVSAPFDGDGKIYHYKRTKDTNNLVQQALPIKLSVDPDDWRRGYAYKIGTKVRYITGSDYSYYVAKNTHVSSQTFDAAEISAHWTEVTNPAYDLLDPRGADYGSSISVSDDGKFLAVGIPKASSIKDRFLGDFDPDASYNKNDVVRHRESLWRAVRSILPQTDNQPFTTFDSYIELTSNSQADSTSINLILTGDPLLENFSTDHLLIRAPLDMYLGTAPDDVVKLAWNIRSFAYPTLDNYFPFDGTIPTISDTFITNTHTILNKVDRILFVETFVSLPEVGDRVVTDTGSGIVVHIGIQGDSTVIYINNTTGTFELTGELFVEDAFIGFYTEEYTINLNEDILGGFWMISTPEYDNGTTWFDVGRGLVYVDVLRTTDTRNLFNYYNIQTAVGTIGTYLDNKNRASYITHLSYQGNPGEVTDIYKSDLFVIRAGKTYSDLLDTEYNAATGRTPGDPSNPTFKFQFYNKDNNSVDLTSVGFNSNVFNKEHVLYDLWDGYIDFEFTNFDSGGFPYEPQVGDIIKDAQFEFDGFGGIAPTEYTTSTAEVVFYQRKANNVRIYVKVISGSWTVRNNNTARVQIRRTQNVTLRPSDATLVNGIIMGTVNNVNDDIAIGTSVVGKLVVVKNTNVAVGSDPLEPYSFDATTSTEIIDEEYYFYNEITSDGAARNENPPNSLNKDWTQIFYLRANSSGTAGPKNEGAVALYRRTVSGIYELMDVLISEYAYANRQFGKQVKFARNKNLYTLYVSSASDEVSIWTSGTLYRVGDVVRYLSRYYKAIVVHTSGIEFNETNWELINAPEETVGSIEIFRHGTEIDRFVGDWSATQNYNIGDIVERQGRYYVALKDQTNQATNQISNPIEWQDISWRRAKDSNYRGEYDFDSEYALGSVVSYNNKLYRANTNIAAEQPLFFVNYFDEITDGLDYIGYLPNTTGNIFYGEEIFDPAQNILDFSRSFDVSANGDILVVTSEVLGSDSATNVHVLIYRLVGDKYTLSQDIEGPIVNSDGFAEKVAINPLGNLIAISEPYEDSNKIDQGKVYIYSQVEGEFVLTQTITTPNNEYAEKFGYNIAFSADNLVVTSLNGDMKVETTFDVADEFGIPREAPTTFDNKFTSFAYQKTDSGMVYVFENVNNILVHSESFLYDAATSLFGENLLAKNNHVYIGLPNYGNDLYRGQVIDYRKPQNTFAWKITSEVVLPVDVSKIKGAFLYNKRENQIVTYLDFIDPIQGKIAGPAEQELTHKVPYDPAIYNQGVVPGIINRTSFWGKEHVGELWWNTQSAKFDYPYLGDIKYRKEKFSQLSEGSTIQIYEWVESTVLPSRWDELSGTEDAVRFGISGTTAYSDNLYTVQYIYDDIAQKFVTRYYFWVINKTTIPNVENRKLSAVDVSRLISRPRENGYRFINFLGTNSFVLNNCEPLITNKDIVLNIKWSTSDKPDQNKHTAYQIITDGLESSVPHPDLELKWFDSLIGFDTQARLVPDITIPVKQRYGVQNKPRQSMFVNRTEAFKQVIERINLVLQEKIITDLYDISDLTEFDSLPTLSSGEYDVKVDSYAEIRFVSTNKLQRAVLTPIIVNGKLQTVRIENPGYGYKVAPSYKITGAGTDAEIELAINNLGQITSVTILNRGYGYTENTTLTVRPFTVLVESDENVQGKWTKHIWEQATKTWSRIAVQSFDMNLYWDYIDWYETGYNTFTSIDHKIESSYQLETTDIAVGEIVKINNIGTGGWLLLEKIDNQSNVDYTVNYKTIGRQNGTIKILDSIYDIGTNSTGFGNRSFDSFLYDNNPIIEARKILEIVRDKLFIGDLKVQWNQLFLSSLRYAFAEQLYVDWAFKTSFIKVKHNYGELEQDITFNTNTQDSYKQYIEEVKPFKTVIREFVTGYEVTENTNSAMSDFDLPPYYDPTEKKIVTSKTKISSNVLYDKDNNLDEYPRLFWSNNYGLQVKEILVKDGGTGWIEKPRVTITGGGGTGAIAEAFIGYGRITSIKVINPGKNYTSQPTITIEGVQSEIGTPAKVSVVLGNGVVRTPSIKIKFDRVNKTYTISNLQQTEKFTGTNVDVKFDLEWPMDLNLKNVSVSVDGNEKLRSEYSFANIKNTDAGYTREQGRITFVTPPALDSVITVTYQKSLTMMTAEDRIQFAYNPISGMLGKDLAQLMSGVDYGGVEITSFDFSGPAGWDTQGWYTNIWDEFDNSYEDEVFTFDGSTIAVQLSQPLEDGVVYNVYLNGIRIDDPNFGVGEVTNPNAIMPSIVGDGDTTVIDIANYGIDVISDDVLIIRKITSDGSFIPDPTSYDTALSGGDLAYETAKGVNAEEIIVDGDGFVTPTTSGGPEELVPGQVLDTLDIKVYTRDSGGQGIISCQNYTMDPNIDTYDLQVIPGSKLAVLVKMDGVILTDSEYTVDWVNNTVTILNPVENAQLSIVVTERSGQNIIDFGTIITDASTNDFELDTIYQEGASVHVTVNGIKTNVVLFESENTGRFVIRFADAPAANKVIHYTLMNNDEIVNYSQITKETFVADGSTSEITLSSGPFYSIPSSHNVIVKVDNQIMNPGYNIEYIIEGDVFAATKEYSIESFQLPSGSISSDDIIVYLNGEEITTPVQWRFDVFNNTIILADGIGLPGDKLEIYTYTGEYRFDVDTLLDIDNPSGSGFEVGETVRFTFSDGDIIDAIVTDYSAGRLQLLNRQNTLLELLASTTNTLVTAIGLTSGSTLAGDTSVNSGEIVQSSNKIIFATAPAQDSVIEVIKFSNHDIAGIERISYDVIDRATLTSGDTSYYTLQRLRLGEITLRRNAASPQYVWIAKNGTLLDPVVDYHLTDDGNKVRLTSIPNESDVIDVIHFAAPISVAKFAYRQFKDILNRTHYKRLDSPVTQLAQTLNSYDLRIEVVDGTELSEPDKGKNLPGIIFVNGERIEYFVKEENTLRQLRRGTLGTGINETISAGTDVYDQNSSKTIPYKDVTQTQVIEASGDTNVFDLEFTPRSENEFEVFVAGRRLRKNYIDVYDESRGLDSPRGDLTVVPEFFVDTSTNKLVLNNTPAEGQKIILVRKIGRLWTDPGLTLGETQNDIANFLRAGTTTLPK